MEHISRRDVLHFSLGVVVTLCVVGLFSVGAQIFFAQRNAGIPLITGADNLDELIKIDLSVFWQFMPNLKNKTVTEVLADEHQTKSTYTFSTNELGFRSPPLKPVGTCFRILAIGDSTTFGQHLADDETWPSQLQQMLDPKGERIEVINAGVIGASSFQGLVFMNSTGLSLRPNLVIVTFGFNDWARSDLSDRERALAYQTRGITGLFQLSVKNWQKSIKSRTGLVQRATPGEYFDNMTAIAQLCKTNNIAIVFLIWTHPNEIQFPKTISSPWRGLLFEVGRVTGALCVDLIPAFQKVKDEKLFLDIVHATPRGCQVVAETLAEVIRENNLIHILR